MAHLRSSTCLLSGLQDDLDRRHVGVAARLMRLRCPSFAGAGTNVWGGPVVLP